MDTTDRRRTAIETRRRRQAGPRAEALEDRRLLATFTVTSTDDEGPGSFRQAIEDANAAVGLDRIEFAIAGEGVRSIRPATELPNLSDPVVIDGRTQPGFAGTPLIELNGSAVEGGTGLELTAGSSTVRGLAINRFFDGISAGGPNNRIVGNFIGTDAAGTLALGNGRGIVLFGDGNSIGGRDPGDRNVLSGNTFSALILSTGSDRNEILGNLIGTDAAGLQPLGNGQGIVVNGSDNRIGGLTTAESNTIANSSSTGVQIGFSSFSANGGNAVLVNSITGNGGLGIDLGDNGVDSNDSFDFDGRPNGGQNYPDLGTAYPSGGSTRVEGVLRSRPGGVYTVRFFSNESPDQSGFGEGETFVGSTVATTDSNGFVAFDFDLPDTVPAGRFLTATATDANGNTSEFSRAVAVAEEPEADLAVSVSPPFFAQVASPFTYFVEVRNDGPARAANVVLTNVLPAGLTFLGGTASRGTVAEDDGVVTATFGTLSPSDLVTVSIEVIATTDGPLTNAVSVASDQADPNPANDRATSRIQVQPEPAVNLAIGGFPDTPNAIVGDEFVATFLVNNDGPNSRATNVELTAILPEGLTLVGINPSQGTASMSGRTVVVALGAIDQGIQPAVRLRLRADAPGLALIDASVDADQVDPNQLNNTVRVAVAVDPSQPADLGLSIVSAPDPVQIGQLLTYSLTVTNAGPGMAEGVVLTNVLPLGAELVGAPQASQGTAAVVDGTLTAMLGTVPVGFTALITYSVRPLIPGNLVNVARLSAIGSDFNPDNNQAAAVVTVVADQVLPVVTAQRLRVERGGIRAIVLTFNKPLNPDLSTAPENFRLTNDRGRRPVPIGSITYDAASQSITLVPVRPLPIGKLFRLSVNGEGAPGVEDLNGTVLDGDYNGLADGIFSSQVGRGTATRPVPFQRGPVGVRPRPNQNNQNRVAAEAVVATQASPKPRVRPNSAPRDQPSN